MSGTIPDYLKKNFDPNTLSIPQLRSILRDHDVENVPAPNQPKRVFVKLFNSEIWDRREEILKKLNIQEPKKEKKAGRKSISKSSDSLKTELPQALRGKSESPVPKENKNKRVSFGVNELKLNYESAPKISSETKETAKPTKPTKPTKSAKSAKELAKPVKEERKDVQPVIKDTINKLNEEHELNNSYSKSYNQEQTGIKTGNVKRTRKKFSDDSKQQSVEIKKSSGGDYDEDEPSPKKRRQSGNITPKASKANTSYSNIFQKFDNQTMEVPQPPTFTSSSSKIPKANIVFAEENDEEDEDYVYQSNSPSMSTSSEGENDVINDEEMTDLKNDSKIDYSEDNNQEIPDTIPVISSPNLDTINYANNNENSPLHNIPKKPSASFSYNKNDNSFVRASKPKSSSFTYNSHNSYAKKEPVPYNTSFNETPVINISYEMSPIQSSQNSVLYDDDHLLNQSRSRINNSNEIGDIYTDMLEEDDEPIYVERSSPIFTFTNICAFLFTLLTTVSIGLFSQWYMHTGGFAGYCPLNDLTLREMTYLDTLPEDSILRYNPFYHILPKCLDCPKNAICDDTHVIGCKNEDDKLQTRVISNIIPKEYLIFPFTEMVCSFDFEKKRKNDRQYQNTRSLMNISIDLIRKRIGEIECEKSKNDADAESPIYVTDSDLRDLLKEEIGKQVRTERLEELWVSMMTVLNKYDDDGITDLCKIEKKTWKTSEKKDDRYLCDVLQKLKYDPGKGMTTTEKPIHTFRCRMKWFMESYVFNNIKSFICRFWMYGLGALILVILAAIVKYLLKKRTRRNNVANSIYEEVIWLLQEAEYQNKEDPLHFPSPNISVAQLYDVLLPTVISPKDKKVPEGDCIETVNDDGSATHYWVFHNPKERTLIWKKVYDQVRANSNVLESNALVKRESHRCWEWIGNPALYIRRKSPNTKHKQTTYNPKVANNSRLSLGGASNNRSFMSQQFADDISAISHAEGHMNESYMTLNEEGKDGDTSLRGHISRLSIYNSHHKDKEENEGDNDYLTVPSTLSSKRASIVSSSSSSVYPRL